MRVSSAGKGGGECLVGTGKALEERQREREKEIEGFSWIDMARKIYILSPHFFSPHCECVCVCMCACVCVCVRVREHRL